MGYMYSDELSDVLRQQVQPLTKMRQLCDAEDGSKKGLNRGDKFLYVACRKNFAICGNILKLSSADNAKI
jgi:hypothetical protein